MSASPPQSVTGCTRPSLRRSYMTIARIKNTTAPKNKAGWAIPNNRPMARPIAGGNIAIVASSMKRLCTAGRVRHARPAPAKMPNSSNVVSGTTMATSGGSASAATTNVVSPRTAAADVEQ